VTEVLQFALLGLGAGAIYALLGQGLVLIFRGSGLLNLAHGAFAMAGAYLFHELHDVSGHGTAVSIVATVVIMAAVGVVTDQLLLRRLRGASPLARLIATLGILLIVQSIGILRYGSDPTLTPPLIAQDPVDVLGATVSSDRLWLLLIAVVLTAVLTVVWRYTRLGWVMSAVSENERAAAAVGCSPQQISALTWGLGAGLAAGSTVVEKNLDRITQLAVTPLTLAIIPALAAALIGGFTSFPLTLAGGLALGIGESLTLRYIDLTGAPASVPFLIIVAVLALRGSTLPLRGYVTDKLPEVGLGRIRPAQAAGAFVAAVVLIGFVFGESWLAAAIVALSVGIILLSLVVRHHPRRARVRAAGAADARRGAGRRHAGSRGGGAGDALQQLRRYLGLPPVGWHCIWTSCMVAWQDVVSGSGALREARAARLSALGSLWSVGIRRSAGSPTRKPAISGSGRHGDHSLSLAQAARPRVSNDARPRARNLDGRECQRPPGRHDPDHPDSAPPRGSAAEGHRAARPRGGADRRLAAALA
jgi:branched-subunit amino acid ABC-type transport system permease component